jgi:hypothetical protein
VTAELGSLGYAAAAIQAGLVVATAAKIFTVGAAESHGADASVTVPVARANAPVVARVVLAEIDLGLAVPAHVARFADALVVVDQLGTII